ncbi:protein YkpC [Bacillus sp. SA1-12]|nr:protein YkpC [Bacillus sp. SA1-12]
MKDLSRRIIISLTLAGIIMGGMSVSLANMPSSPAGNNEIGQVQGE